MKILSVPLVILLALAATVFTSSRESRDPDTDPAEWVLVDGTRSFRPGIRPGDAELLAKSGVPGTSIDRELRVGLDPIEVRSLLVLRHEVTRGDYAAFLASEDGAEIKAPAGWTRRRPTAGEENLPVVGVTRAQAAAYAAWRNGRLPTEWEWEFVFRGETGNYYPWGNTFDGHKAVTSTGGPQSAMDDRYRTGEFWHVSGNVAEWTSSDTDGLAVARGGSFKGRSHDSRLTARELVEPTVGHGHVGFRIVKDI